MGSSGEGIAGWIARRAARKPGATALVDVATGVRHTYAELDRRVDARAADLAAAGVGSGDRVALLGENSAAYLEWLFATARLGALTVPINFRLSAGEVAYVLADSGATVLAHSAAFARLAEAVASAAARAIRRWPGPCAGTPIACSAAHIVTWLAVSTGLPSSRSSGAMTS